MALLEMCVRKPPTMLDQSNISTPQYHHHSAPLHLLDHSLSDAGLIKENTEVLNSVYRWASV